MIYDDRTGNFNYEQQSIPRDQELTIEFTPEDEHAYRALLTVEGGFGSSQLQGKVKAQTAEKGTAYAETVTKKYDISPA